MSAGDQLLFRLLHTAGVLRVQICPLCAALIVAQGRDQHERVHAAELADVDNNPPDTHSTSSTNCHSIGSELPFDKSRAGGAR